MFFIPLKRITAGIVGPALCIFICFPLSLLSQQENTWYLAKQLNNKNVLPQSSARALYFDTTSGFLWITTEAGVVRYDGVNATTFDKRELPALKGVRMAEFYYSFKEGIFTADRGGVVCRINGPDISTRGGANPDTLGALISFWGNLSSFSQLNAINSRQRNFGVNDEEKKSGDFILRENPLYILNINSEVWCSYSKSRLLLINGTTKIADWPLRENETPRLIDRGTDIFAVNSDGSYYFINSKAKTCERFTINDFPASRERSIIYYDYVNHQPLLLSDNRLFKLLFKEKEIELEFVATLESLPRNVSTVIMHPNQSRVFVSSLQDGVRVYEKSVFRTYTVNEMPNRTAPLGEEINNVYSVQAISAKTALTSSHVLFNLETGDGVVMPLKIGRAMTMVKDDYENVLMGIGDTIVRFNPATGKMVHGLTIRGIRNNGSNSMRSAFTSRSGRTWISTDLYTGYLSGDTAVPYTYSPAGEKISFVYMSESETGDLYGATENGLYHIDTINKRYDRIEGVNIQPIRSFNFDKSGNCWIATYGNGIYLYDQKSKNVFKVPVDPNGYLLYSHTLIDDSLGNFIIPTNRGLFRINIGHMIAVAKSGSKTISYQYFSAEDGLLSTEFNGGCSPALNRLPNGDILLPSLEGLVRVIKNNLPNPISYPVYLTTVRDFSDNYLFTADSIQGKTIPSGQRNLVWNVVVAQWGQDIYRGIFYQLDDQPWVNLAEGSGRIRLVDLGSGAHTLRVKAVSSLSPDSAKFYEVKFRVAKRFTETVLFALFIILVISLITVGLVLLRNKRLKNKNKRLAVVVQEKTLELQENNAALTSAVGDLNVALTQVEQNERFLRKLVGVLGHDIMSPLQYIGRVSNQLITYGNRLKPETTTEAVADIGVTASRLYYMSENLIHWIKIQEGLFTPDMASFNVYDVVQELFSFHEKIAAEKKNTLINTARPDFTCTQDQVVVKVILNNLLLNANKYTSGGEITVGAIHTDTLFQLSVQDTGVGMDEESVAKLNRLVAVTPGRGTAKEMGWGLGYTLIIDMVRFMNAKLLVESEKGKGTKVTINFRRMQF